MIARTCLLALVLLTPVSRGQAPTAQPYKLPDLIEGVANPGFADIPELTDSVRRLGIDFNVGDQELGEIIDAGAKGKRNPGEMAGLIRAVLNACQDCRARYLTPLSVEELQTLLKRFTPEAVFREVRARGVTGLEMSGATANFLRASGAREDLIAFLVPDDKIPTIPLVAPYQTVVLKRAHEYDPGAQEGWLKINMELPPGSQSEFIFKHTALFIQTTEGAGPKDIQAYFSKPAPRNKTAEFIAIECGLDSPELVCGQEVLDPKRGTWVRSVQPKKSKNKTPLAEYTYVAPDDDGRAGFRIAVSNPEKTPQKYSVNLTWRVLDAPKPPPSLEGKGDGKGGKR
jgi:hypothetical protein